MSKSNHAIASEISKRFTQEGTGYADRLYQLAYAIEQALNAERERCAKIAETAYTEYQTGYNAGMWIADKIRGKD